MSTSATGQEQTKIKKDRIRNLKTELRQLTQEMRAKKERAPKKERLTKKGEKVKVKKHLDRLSANTVAPPKVKSKSGSSVREFHYLTYMSLRKQWLLGLTKGLQKRMGTAEARMRELRDNTAAQGHAVESLDKWTPDKSEEWICSDDFIKKIVGQAEENVGLFRAPQINKSANNMLHDAMAEIAQQTLIEYTQGCRAHDRTIVNTVDWASQVLSKHGLKAGTALIEKVKRSLVDQALHYKPPPPRPKGTK
jgi:hypothetical protein